MKLVRSRDDACYNAGRDRSVGGMLFSPGLQVTNLEQCMKCHLLVLVLPPSASRPRSLPARSQTGPGSKDFLTAVAWLSAGGSTLSRAFGISLQVDVGETPLGLRILSAFGLIFTLNVSQIRESCLSCFQTARRSL